MKKLNGGQEALPVEVAYSSTRKLSIEDPLGIAVALRLDMWGRALAMIREMPFTGIGLDTFPVVQTQFYPGYLLGPEPHAHNVLLQVALDQGLPGLLAFVALLGAAAAMAVRACRLRPGRDETALILGLVAGLLAYLVANQIDTLWHPKFGVLLWVLLGLLAAVWQVAEREAHPSAAVKPARRWARALPWALLPLLLGLSLLLFPAAWERNVGTLQAQKALWAVRAGGALDPAQAGAALRHLRRGMAGDPDPAHALGLAGGLYAWQGDYAAALAAYARQVELEGRNPVERYVPYEALRRRLTGAAGADPWADLAGAYAAWMTRFPQRAETYAAAAILYERQLGNTGRAQATLETGLQRGARPAGLLEWYLAQLAGGG